MSSEKLHAAICHQIGLPNGTEFILSLREPPGSNITLTELCKDNFCDYRRRPMRYDLQVIESHPVAGAVNDVGNQLAFLANNLGMEYCFQHALDETFGNALLWKKDLGATHPSRITIKIGDTEARSFVSITVAVDGIPLTIYNTHLDDRREETRIQQARILLSQLDQSRPHIIVGDLNALRRVDYSDAEVTAIAEKRKNAKTREKLEDPKFELLQELEQRHYISSIPFAITCEHGTRIDYILLNECAKQQFTTTDARTIPTEATDHSMITMVISKK